MSIAADHIPFFRAAWADRYVDHITFARPTRGSYDPKSKQYETPPGNQIVYTGACLITPIVGPVSPSEFGLGASTRYDYTVRLPYTAPILRPDTVGTVDGSEHDPALVGVALTVRACRPGSYRTSTVAYCEQIV